MADDALDNAALDPMDLLPPPPKVIDIDNEIIPDIPSISQLHLPFKMEYILPSPARMLHPKVLPNLPVQAHYPTNDRRPPQHLQDYFYFFMTVDKEHCQKPAHPYTTSDGTQVDLAINDENMKAHVCPML